MTLATEMQVRLTEGEQARLRYTTTTNVEAWNLWVQGLNHYRSGAVSRETNLQVRQYWEKALALDPGSASLNAMLGFMHFADARFGWSDDRAGGDRQGGGLCRAGAVDRSRESRRLSRLERRPAPEVALRRGGGGRAQGREARPQPA